MNDDGDFMKFFGVLSAVFCSQFDSTLVKKFEDHEVVSVKDTEAAEKHLLLS